MCRQSARSASVLWPARRPYAASITRSFFLAASLALLVQTWVVRFYEFFLQHIKYSAMQIMRLESGVSFWICRISVSGSPFSVPRSPFLSHNCPSSVQCGTGAGCGARRSAARLKVGGARALISYIIDYRDYIHTRRERGCMGCRLCQNPTFHEDMILDG